LQLSLQINNVLKVKQKSCQNNASQENLSMPLFLMLLFLMLPAINIFLEKIHAENLL
jgi:hypothetical protein